MKINIGDIILVILFIISISIGLWYLFGDSPTFEQSMILMSAVFGMAINMGRSEVRLNYIEKRFDTLEKNVKNGFDKIREDMGLIKKKLKI